MSYEFMLKNIKTISKESKKKLAAEGYLTMKPIFDSTGRLHRREYFLNDKARLVLGIPVELERKEPVERRSNVLKFCSACGKGHWRKGKQFCSEECKQEKNWNKKKKELDFEMIMREIRAKKAARKKELQQKQKLYYVENREKIKDYQVDYRHRKMQEQILLTILTTTI